MVDFSNQTSIEQCRLGNSTDESLPDLNTEDVFVEQTLLDFIANFTSFWGIDGYRLDSARHVRHDFYPAFVDAARVFVSGEVLKTYDDEYVASYVIDGGIPTVENYNAWKYIQSVFTTQDPPQTFVTLDQLLHNQSSVFPNPHLLTTFIENMDIGRFLQTDLFGGTSDPSLTQDQAKYKNALTLLLTMPGIPMVYYGAEQALYSRNGDVDSYRMELWYSLYDTTTDLYGWITQLVSLRRMYADNVLGKNITTLFVEDEVYAYARGPVLAVLSAEGYTSSSHSIVVPNLPYAAGTVLVRLDDWTVTVTVPAGGSLNVTIYNGRPLVFIPRQDLSAHINQIRQFGSAIDAGGGGFAGFQTSRAVATRPRGTNATIVLALASLFAVLLLPLLGTY
ncbi:Alpha-amylase A type-1/2 [Cladochytrium tenue]|nr:Alpha-amylase A type-1/2 [Cladochytrium tenue]